MGPPCEQGAKEAQFTSGAAPRSMTTRTRLTFEAFAPPAAPDSHIMSSPRRSTRRLST